MRLFGIVTELWRYPLSSMGGERLNEADLRAGGVHGDRLWGVMDKANGEIAGPEKRRHWRSLPNLGSRLGTNGPEVSKGDGVWLPVQASEAAELVSNHLGFPVELRPHSAFQHGEEGHVAPRYGRADIHIVTSASMRTLEELLGSAEQVDSRRFRPNIVIETEQDFSGFAEHQIIGQALQIRQARLAVTEPCARCAFTTIAQGNLSFEPAVLHKIAQHGEGGFGTYCAVIDCGRTKLGDPVYITDA